MRHKKRMTSVGNEPAKRASEPDALDRVDEALRLEESKRKVIDWNARYKSERNARRNGESVQSIAKTKRLRRAEPIG